MPEKLRMDLERPGSNKIGKNVEMFVHMARWLMLSYFPPQTLSVFVWRLFPVI